MQRKPRQFATAPATGAPHSHSLDAITHYLRPPSDVSPHDVHCIMGECYVGVSYAARRLGNLEAAQGQAQAAVQSAQGIQCSRLEASAQAALAMALFHSDKYAG